MERPKYRNDRNRSIVIRAERLRLRLRFEYSRLEAYGGGRWRWRYVATGVRRTEEPGQMAADADVASSECEVYDVWALWKLQCPALGEDSRES